jgi:hypothetical protein
MFILNDVKVGSTILCKLNISVTKVESLRIVACGGKYEALCSPETVQGVLSLILTPAFTCVNYHL